MSVLKWVLIVLGALILLGIVIVVGGFYWASTVESVKLTTADLDVGGAYSPEERQALLAACKTRRKAPAGGDDKCGCIADRAGTDFSRFERLVFTASFEGSPTRIVALTKGLIDSGIPQARVDALQKDSQTRIESLMKACGFEP